MEGKIAVRGVELWYRITRRGRAGGADPRRRVRPLQLRPGDPGAVEALPRRRLRHARLRAVRPARAGLRHGGLGRRPRRPHGRARDRPGARARDVDGRDDRDRLRGQVPGAHPFGRDQLRGSEARRQRPADLQELDRHRTARPRRAWKPAARRADHLAGALEALPRRAGRRRARRLDPADPARLEPHRGLHRRLPGDVRHGPAAVAAAHHLARARARRRRGSDDAVGPGARRCGPAGDRRRHRRRREARRPRGRTTRPSSTRRTSTTGS